jgi:hypothetical protein
MLLHRLEQSRLRLRWGSIDLVGQKHLAENGAFPKNEVIGSPIENVCPRDIGWKQVGGELDTLVLTAENPSKRLGKARFSNAGHTFEQDMSIGDEGDQKPFGDCIHPDDNAGNLVLHLLSKDSGLCNKLAQCR